MNYKILRRANEETLSSLVESYCKQGWLLHGSPFHVYMDGGNWFCQAMVKP